MTDLEEHAFALEQLAASIEQHHPFGLMPGWPEQLRKTAALLRAGDSSIELAATVMKMREQQRLYFKMRDRDAMKRSMELERRVDAMLAQGVEVKAKAQGDLFGKAGR